MRQYQSLTITADAETSENYLGLKNITNNVPQINLGAHGGIMFNNAQSARTEQRLRGAIYVGEDTASARAWVTLGDSSSVKYFLESTISGSGCLAFKAQADKGSSLSLTADNSAYIGRLEVEGNGTGVATLVVTNANALGGACTAATTDALVLTNAILRVADTTTLNAANRGVTIKSASAISVDDGKTFTLNESLSFASESTTLTKTGAGTFELTGTMASKGTIMVEDGSVILPKGASYTLGEKTSAKTLDDGRIKLSRRYGLVIIFR